MNAIQLILDRSHIPDLRTNQHTTCQYYRTFIDDVYELLAESMENIDKDQKLSAVRFDSVGFNL